MLSGSPKLMTTPRFLTAVRSLPAPSRAFINVILTKPSRFNLRSVDPPKLIVIRLWVRRLTYYGRLTPYYFQRNLRPPSNTQERRRHSTDTITLTLTRPLTKDELLVSTNGKGTLANGKRLTPTLTPLKMRKRTTTTILAETQVQNLPPALNAI